MKKILIGHEVFSKLLGGVKTLDPVVSTLYGPLKGNVISRIHSLPAITNFFSGLIDSLDLEDAFEDTGMLLMKDVVKDVRNAAGAGAGVCAILTLALLREGNKLLTAGVGKSEIVDQLRKLAQEFDGYVRSRAAALENYISGRERDAYYGVAKTATGDPEISQVIADMFMHVGADGTVELKRGEGFKTKVDYIDGFTFKTSALSYKFLGTNKKLEFENPYIVVSTAPIDIGPSLVDVLVKCNKDERPLVIVAESLSTSALDLILHNTAIGSLKCVAVKPPAYGGDKFIACKDLAVASGARVLSSEDKDTKLCDSTMGQADKAIVTPATCSLIYSKSNITPEYIAQVEAMEKEEHRPIFKKHLKERIGNLKGKAAVVTVGGASASDRELNYYHVEFATHAVRGAMTDGFLPGGCQIFYDFSRLGTRDELKSLRLAFSAPFEMLFKDRLRTRSLAEFLVTHPTQVYDLISDSKVDMLESGIIDSAKVVRSATAAAVSMASTILSAGAIVREE